MAAYPPPSENPPIFNPNDFTFTINQEHLDGTYLRLNAQQNENMNGYRITDIAAPIDPSDCARIADITSLTTPVSAYLPLTGGVSAASNMLGDININTHNLLNFGILDGNGTGVGQISCQGKIETTGQLVGQNITADGGSISAAGGNIVTTAGSITSFANINATTGNIYANAGEIGGQTLLVAQEGVNINSSAYKFPNLGAGVFPNDGDVLAATSAADGTLAWTQHPVSNQVIHQDNTALVGIAGTALRAVGTNGAQNIYVGATAPSLAATIDIGTGDLTTGGDLSANNLTLAGAITNSFGTLTTLPNYWRQAYDWTTRLNTNQTSGDTGFSPILSASSFSGGVGLQPVPVTLLNGDVDLPLVNASSQGGGVYMMLKTPYNGIIRKCSCIMPYSENSLTLSIKQTTGTPISSTTLLATSSLATFSNTGGIGANSLHTLTPADGLGLGAGAFNAGTFLIAEVTPGYGATNHTDGFQWYNFQMVIDYEY